jgi:hypothetical protein
MNLYEALPSEEIERLKMIEEMAGLFFSPELIAVNIELTEDETEEFLAQIEARNTFHFRTAAYYKGWLEAEVSLRTAIKQSAMNGSSPSQQMMLNFQKEARV